MSGTLVAEATVDAVELDLVPTDLIEFGSDWDMQRWLAYSLLVLTPRGRALEQRARSLMFNPFRYLRWLRAQREWEENTRRQEAILGAASRWHNRADGGTR